jgi:antitoxin Phd
MRAYLLAWRSVAHRHIVQRMYGARGMSKRHNANTRAAGKNEPYPAGVAAGRRSWRVREARTRLGSLIDEALAGRPQRISRRGADVAVLVSAADYDRLMEPPEDLVQFFRDHRLPRPRQRASSI